MRLDWDRPGVVRATLKVQELAALVAGARLTAVALAAQSAEQADALEWVLIDFDRAVTHLGRHGREEASALSGRGSNDRNE